MADRITHLKSNSISLTPAKGDAYVAEEVDLGLGIDEAARIVGVYLNVIAQLITDGNVVVRAGYSFDPEDTTLVSADDECFAFIEMFCHDVGLAYDGNWTYAIYQDFSHLNLITTRNVAFIGYGYNVDCTQGVNGKLFYEKYRPTDRELVQLIAQRR